MPVVNLDKLKSLATMYMLVLIMITSIFTIFIDYKALKKKNLNKEAKACRVLGYVYLVGGAAFFIIMNYVV